MRKNGNILMLILPTRVGLLPVGTQNQEASLQFGYTSISQQGVHGTFA